MPKFKVYAELHGKRLQDSEAVLGEAFDVEYDSEDEALDVATFLEEGVPDCDPEVVNINTRFKVEEA